MMASPEMASPETASPDLTRVKSNGSVIGYRAVRTKSTVSNKPPAWQMTSRVQHHYDHSQQNGRKLGVTWSGLTVEALSADATVNENFTSQFNIPAKIKASRGPRPMKRILDNTHGCVKPGEMLLVLGRPGSGCTTLLKLLANRRHGFASISGDVHYGSMTHKEAEQYRGQIVMNTEEELFFPTLTVGQTIDFAARMKVPSNREGISAEDYEKEERGFLLDSMGIAHTDNTKVGNEFVRGVSGGERKRVSIIETLATRASVFCWDNSTRGLDASTALEYTRAIRAMTDVLGLASIVTLYQAGNGIYELFDKVLVLDSGMEVYYGPMKEARPFMEGLGFLCREGSNVADYLTGVTVPTERRIADGFGNTYPKTASEVRTAYEKSSIITQMQSEYTFPQTEVAQQDTRDFQQSIHAEKDRQLSKKSPLTTSITTQIKACVTRQYQIIWGDKATLLIKQFSSIAQALIAGSLFYNAPDTSAGLFIKAGAIFFALLFNSLLAMSEVTDSFTGRPVLTKHKSFAFYHPAAFCLAQIAADIPVLLVQVSVFSIVLYFMVGLTQTAGAFFTFWIVVFSGTMVSFVYCPSRITLLTRSTDHDGMFQSHWCRLYDI